MTYVHPQGARNERRAIRVGDSSVPPRPDGSSQHNAPKPRRRVVRKRKNRAPPPPPSDDSDSSATSCDPATPVYTPSWARRRDWDGALLDTEPETQTEGFEGPGLDFSLKCTLALVAALAVRSVLHIF